MSADEIDPDSSVPMYRQLAEILTRRIETGYYPPRRRIASKKEAMQEFGISDKTYDRAAELLRDAGLIESVRGKGSFVIDRR
jgi:DNA-binding GntR family transcriptional regulator